MSLKLNFKTIENLHFKNVIKLQDFVAFFSLSGVDFWSILIAGFDFPRVVLGLVNGFIWQSPTPLTYLSPFVVMKRKVQASVHHLHFIPQASCNKSLC